MANGLEALAARIHAFPAELGKAIAGAATEVMTSAALDGAPKGFMGIALRVRVTTATNSTGATVTVAPVPAGPWTIAEVGSYKKPGGWTIPNPGGRRLKFPDENIRISVHHPGIRGQHAWTEARARMTDAFNELMATVGEEAWGAVIDG